MQVCEALLILLCLLSARRILLINAIAYWAEHRLCSANRALGV